MVTGYSYDRDHWEGYVYSKEIIMEMKLLVNFIWLKFRIKEMVFPNL